jgi:transcriptional regulator with XRE-family HTH domain
MTGPRAGLSIGERVAYHRRRRGLTQEALGGLIGKTTSWVEKIEHGRAPLDRISVVRDLANVLGIAFSDLVPDSVEPDVAAGPKIKDDVTLSYFAVNPRFAVQGARVPIVGVTELRRQVDDVWKAYQDSRWGYVIMRLNQLLPAAHLAKQREDAYRTVTRALAHLYHVAASVLVKLGDLKNAQVCAERGDMHAREIDDPVVLTSLQRGVAHALLSNGEYENAVRVVRDRLVEEPEATGPAGLSVTGTLMLVGATGCARAGERAEALTFLRHAGQLAEQLGRDGNDVWTAFGPTNVAIHRVTVAAELRDFRQAVDLGATLDVRTMPRERRVRHRLEVARGLFYVGRRDDALHTILDVERAAPEQVRHHFLTHEVVQELKRTIRARPDPDLVALARRLRHAA